MIRNGFIVLVVFLSLFSCSKNESFKTNSTLVVDDLGRTIELEGIPQRVVSLAPSITELLYFIGADSQIVSRTQACDYPQEALNLPIVSTYPFDIESIIKLNPDLVISVDGIVNADQVTKLNDLGIKVFFQKYETIEDINRSIVTIGSLLGKGKKASLLVDSLNSALNNFRESKDNPLQTLMVTWHKPIFLYGKDTPFTSKVELIGAENAIKEKLNSPYPEVSREYILKLNPDVILGYSFEKMDSTFFTLYPELKHISAYKKKQIFDVDDNLMSRPSPRYIESIIELKEILANCE